jgi:glycosyltransferase involved in cell wall biosynthesis
MVVLEAMAMGKAVIGSNIGGIPEQIKDGETGFLFNMGKSRELAYKMEKLWFDKNLRTEMGKAARRKIEMDFSLKKHCNALMKIYNRLLPN